MPAPEQSSFFVFHDFEDTPPTPYGRRLDEWPLRFTVTPFFTLGEVPEGRVLDTVTSVSEAALPIEVFPGDEAFYGPNHDVHVTKVVDQSGELHYFHEELIAKLGEAGCHFSDLQYAGKNYSPHVSHKDGGPFLTDAMYIARSISVGRKLSDLPKPNKEVVRRIELP